MINGKAYSEDMKKNRRRKTMSKTVTMMMNYQDSNNDTDYGIFFKKEEQIVGTEKNLVLHKA